MTYEVRDVVCDYGVYENGELKLILNSKRIALEIVKLLEEDERIEKLNNIPAEVVKVEIEGLEETRYELACIIDELREERERLLQKLQQAKSEAIKEFARELKCGVPQETGVIRCKDIDDLVKQMTEVKENEKYCKRSLLKGGAK